MTEQQQPQPGEIWRHTETNDECLFIGRCRDGQMVWQCDGDTVETGDLDWTGWERVGVAVPRVNPGWIVKGEYGVEHYESKPNYNELQGDWSSEECPLDAACLVDPWSDKPNGGPDCILEIH